MAFSKFPFVRLLQYMRPYRKDYILGIVYSLLNKLFDIAPEILIGIAVDVVVKQEHSLLAKFGFVDVKDQLLMLGALTFFVWCFESFFEYLYSIKWRNLAQSIQHHLRLETYEHIQHLDLATLEKKNTGNLLSILNDDVNQLERFLETGVNEILQILFSSVLIGILFWIMAPAVAVVAMFPIPLILVGAFYFQRRLAPKFLTVREKAGDLGARLENNLVGMVTIKSFVAEDYEYAQVEKESEGYRVANQEAIALSSVVNPIIRIAVLAGFLATLILGGYQTIEGSLSVGIFSALVFMTQRFLWPLTRLAEISVLYQRSMASSTRIFNLLFLPRHVRTGDQPLFLEKVQGDIVFDEVFFAYGDRPALKGISFHIGAGKTIGFVGESGSGKSTLIKLLLRFYEPESGKILLDQRAIADYLIPDLRRAIGLVSQDVFLFQGTVAENIAYALPHTSQEEIIYAAQQAEAHDFILRLPQGYQTEVGERGQRLSGGQRQRLALARALLRQPPVLILDEATSSVDNETERAIQKSLESITEGRTTLVIAHRLSTVRHADWIYVLQEGCLVEEGTHDLLVAQKGFYTSLWNLQTGQIIF